MHLLIAAAGSGRRMGASGNKLLLKLSGRPVLAWTLDAVFASNAIKWIGIVGQPIDRPSIMNLFENPSKPIKWINGGTTRQESVQLGLSALPVDAQSLRTSSCSRAVLESGTS